MKMRKPRSPLKKMQSKAKRKMKKAIVPGYGKGGASLMKNPTKTIVKKVSGQPITKKSKKGSLSWLIKKLLK